MTPLGLPSWRNAAGLYGGTSRTLRAPVRRRDSKTEEAIRSILHAGALRDLVGYPRGFLGVRSIRRWSFGVSRSRAVQTGSCRLK